MNLTHNRQILLYTKLFSQYESLLDVKNRFDKKQQPDKEKWVILKIQFLHLKQSKLCISSIHISNFCPEYLLFPQCIERFGLK